jgi:hydroxymethylpyrimidine pyrophosphatase-like HAD family hydrolase
MVVDVCSELGIDDPVICTNGARVYGTPNGPLWCEHAIPMELATEMASIADGNGWEMSTTVGEDTFLKRRPGQDAGRLRDHVYLVEQNADGISNAPIRIIYWQPDAVEFFSRFCANERRCRSDTIYRPTGQIHTLCVFGAHADKGEGLRLVLDRLAIAPAQTLAIGDNTNDVSMFDVAGISIAMGNAVAAVQNHADAVAPSNDDEGVAWAFQKYVIGESCG